MPPSSDAQSFFVCFSVSLRVLVGLAHVEDASMVEVSVQVAPKLIGEISRFVSYKSRVGLLLNYTFRF